MLTFLRFAIRVLFRLRFEGDVNAFKAEKLLIVANHPSLLDGLLLGLCLPVRPVVVFPSEETGGWLMQMVLSRIAHMAVDIGDPLVVKKVIKLLDAGRAVVLFPEGRTTQTGSLMKVYEMPALIALKSGASVASVYLDGPDKSLFARRSNGLPKRWFPRITLHIQGLIAPNLTGVRIARKRRQAAASWLRHIMEVAAFSARSRESLFETFLDAAATHGWGTRVVEDVQGANKSYSDLLKTSLALGCWACRFSEPKEVVGVLLPNLTTTVCMILGLSAMSRVPAILNYTFGARGLESACGSVKLRTIITTRRFLELTNLVSAARSLSHINLVYLEDFQERFTITDKLWLAGFANWWPRLATSQVDPDDPAVVMFTSGSEGQPKGVALSHNAILANIAQLRAITDFTPNDKVLNVLPLYHAYGFTICTIMPLLTGAKLFLYSSPLHYRIIPEIAYRQNCTYLFGTSAFLGRYAEHAHPYDFYRVRYVISGGEKLHDQVRRIWLEKFGLRILEGYGTAECAPVLAFNSPHAYKEGTVGRFLPGVEYRLEPVPGIDRGGVLHVRGPNVMLGYYLYHDPGVLQPPRSLFGEGWHNTGDVVEVDEEGFVTIKGRVKRFAKVAGEMVSLEVTEDIACHASPHHQHAAVLRQDARRGEIIMLFTTDPRLDRIALSRAAKQLGSPELTVPRGIVHAEALPLLGTGKTDYVKLKGLAQAEPEADFAEMAPHLG